MTATTHGAKTRFPIRIGRRSKPVLLLFGVRTSNSYVDLSSDEVDAHFGFFRLRVPLTNVARWSIEGPWLWIKAIGVRRGIRDGDISFDGNHDAGVRLDFRERMRWSIFNVPRLYVSVADPEGFGRALSERGIPGEDLRKRQ